MRKEPFNKLMTIEDESKIIDLYKEGFSALKILQELDNKFKTTKTIYDVLKKFDISTREKTFSHDPNLDHFYFSLIDSPAKAYLLGLMISDGWVVKPQLDKYSSYITRNAQIAFSLQERDLELVEWVKCQWNSQNKINIISKTPMINSATGKIYNSKDMSRIVVTSSKMYQDLNKLGIDENKSYVSILPIIPREFYSHLFRGIIDGDGTIGVYSFGSKRKYLTIKFLGTQALIAQIALVLHYLLGLSYLKPITQGEKGKILSAIEYMIPKEVEKLVKWIYNDKDLGAFLVRKYKLVENYNN